jgi:hypothetical protein
MSHDMVIGFATGTHYILGLEEVHQKFKLSCINYITFLSGYETSLLIMHATENSAPVIS